jgi:hypothetical protein
LFYFRNNKNVAKKLSFINLVESSATLARSENYKTIYK